MLLATTTTNMSCISRHGQKCCVQNQGIISTLTLPSRTTRTAVTSSPSDGSCLRCTALLLRGNARSASAFAINNPLTVLGANKIVQQQQQQPEQNSSSRQQTMVMVAAARFSTTRTSGRRTRRSSGGGGGVNHSNLREERGDASENSSSTREGYSSSNNVDVARRKRMSMEYFHTAANNLLDKVEIALTKLKVCNDRLDIVRHPPTTPLSSSSSSSSTTNNDSRLIDNGTAVSDDAVLQHGGKLVITVLSSADLYWGGGTYSLTIHPDDFDTSSQNNNATFGNVREGGGAGGFITLQSPLSGTYTYIYNVATHDWVGEEDGHSLLGMLTRDWIRQCNGVPDF